jgi:hypothetical protein
MALPTAAPGRRLQHRRQIDVQVFSRGDGLWEVDARVSDVRPEAVELASGPRPAGAPIHDMLLRLVVDARFEILEAGARTLAMPYEQACSDYGDLYGGLAGLNLMKGFRRAVAERFGGVRGCTHINELAQVLPTAVVQAFAGEVFDTRGDGPQATKPFQIDRCRALRSDGPTVLAYYPRWYRPAAPTPSIPAESAPARNP